MAETPPDLRKEYFETVRAEVLWRINQRDQWLKIQLLAQIAIFAFANGVDLGFIKASKPLDVAVAFAFPASVTLAIFYVVEDRLVGLAGLYLGALARTMPQVDQKYLLPFDASPQLRRYSQEGTLLVRLIGQFLAFVVLPATILMLGARTEGKLAPQVVLISWGCAGLILILILWSFIHRRTTGTPDSESVLLESWPTSDATLTSQFLRVGYIVVALAAFAAIVAGLWQLRVG